MAGARARLITTMAIALAMASIASVARAQSVEFRRGLSAFNRAEYAVALENWAPRARAGEPESQSGLGFLYYKGLGVPQDSATAFEWYSRAPIRASRKPSFSSARSIFSATACSAIS